MTQIELQNIFLEGAGIENDRDDNIAIGWLHPYFAPAGIDAVMAKYTNYIDGLLQQLPEGNIGRLEVFIRRGFTFSEYQCLFDSTIKENNFGNYPVFSSLWITKEKERRRWTFTFSKDGYDDYLTILVKALSPFAPLLVNFFFTVCRYGKSFSKKSFEPTRFDLRKKW